MPTYVLHGTNRLGEKVDRVVLEGGSVSPIRWIDLGKEAELTDEEAANLRDRGLDIRRVRKSAPKSSSQNRSKTLSSRQLREEV